MRNLLLSVALIAAPVGLFAAGYTWLASPAAPPRAAAPALGDMTPFAAIVSHVQATVGKGDLAAAAARITDLETAWDKAEPSLQPLSPADWGHVDGAIDTALGALRAGTPDPAQVNAALAGLQAALADPSRGGSAGTVTAQTVSGIATTDANGHPLPCEAMLKTFRTMLDKATLSDAERAKVTTLQAKGTERCNADDDARADDFLAQGIALMAN